MRTIEQVIKRQLVNVEMRQAQLARALRVSDAYLSAMLKGKTAISPKRLIELLEHLNLEPRDSVELFQAYLAAGRPIPWSLVPDDMRKSLAMQVGTLLADAWQRQQQESEDGQD